MDTPPVTDGYIGRLFAYLNFENATTLIAILTALSISLSVLLQVGYLSALDIRLVYFFSLQDAFANAFTIFPLIFPILILGTMIVDIVRYGNDSVGISLETAEFSLLNPSSLIMYTGVLFQVLGLYLGLSLLGLGIGLFVTGLGMAIRGAKFERHNIRRRFAITLIFLSTVFSTMGVGELYAYRDMNFGEYMYEIKMDEALFRAIILRATPEFIIVRDESKNVRLISRAKIDEINFLRVHP